MKSIRDIYKVGKGPSSSHTMGPAKAAELFKSEHEDADKFKVILYGSLSKTGKGHGTDRALKMAMEPVETEVLFSETDPQNMKHPNTLDLFAYKNGEEIATVRVESIGGGDIIYDGHAAAEEEETYIENSFAEIRDFCAYRRINLVQYVELNEGTEIWDFLLHIWDCMKQEIHEGLQKDGVLPGGLDVRRKAKQLYEYSLVNKHPEVMECQAISAYAYAASEQNADNGTIVTAPTCGSCGVVPALLYYLQQKKNKTDLEIAHALGVAGLFGELAKRNASVSGAECGCQAEVGVACAMAAAAAGVVFGYDIGQIEYAAEISIEHHLGLTCDPICGLVQIPCIERNAVAAMRALNAANLSYFLADTRTISYDMVLKSMYQTGKDLSHLYRETSEGGLARAYARKGDK